MSISKSSPLSSFFPKNWPLERILSEVNYAANNIIGMHPFYTNAYIGVTKDGIQITFLCKDIVINGKKTKKVISFFPLYENYRKFE